jgi:hypothetical protein
VSVVTFQMSHLHGGMDRMHIAAAWLMRAAPSHAAAVHVNSCCGAWSDGAELRLGTLDPAVSRPGGLKGQVAVKVIPTHSLPGPKQRQPPQPTLPAEMTPHTHHGRHYSIRSFIDTNTTLAATWGVHLTRIVLGENEDGLDGVQPHQPAAQPPLVYCQRGTRL